MIVLFTDFGLSGPYVGQMHAVLAQQAPGVPVIDLFHDVPAHEVQAGAYLLPAYTQYLPPEAIVVGVVDPGVGGDRRALMMRADRRWYVGPDNGLFELVARQARVCEVFEIRWRPESLSASFHGRDLFAPVAARIARGQRPESVPTTLSRQTPAWPDDLSEILYVDRFGNLLTGIRAITLGRGSRIRCGDSILEQASTYERVPPGAAFWYENSNGLVEFAVNQGRAAERLQASIGTRFEILSPDQPGKSV